jgi:hypothetical protein
VQRSVFEFLLPLHRLLYTRLSAFACTPGRSTMSSLPSPPSNPQGSRSSTSGLSQQSTLIPGTTRQSTTASGNATPSSEALRKALEAFCRRLSVEEQARFANTTYAHLRNDMIQLQREQERRKEMMNLSRIQGFLEAMQQLSKTIEIW